MLHPHTTGPRPPAGAHGDLYDQSSGTSTNPLTSACRRWQGCVAWPAGRHRPGWRQCPQHSHCSSLMEISGPPCVGASANPTLLPALLPPPASVGPKSALREPSMPSHAMPSMHCACCAMMQLWSCSNSAKELGLAVLHPRAMGFRKRRPAVLPRGGTVHG